MNHLILSRFSTPVEKALRGKICLFAGIFLGFSFFTDRFATGSPGSLLQRDIAHYSDHSETEKLLEEKKWTEAAILLKAELRKSPESSPVALDLARALIFTGRREEALSLLNQAFGKEKGQAKVNLQQRLRVLSRVFLSNTTFQTYQDGLNLLVGKKYRSARERFEKSLEMEPYNAEVLTRIGQCLVLDGDQDSAAERLRLAYQLNPFEPEISLWLGKALKERGELREALEHLKKAQSELPGSEMAAVWYSDALVAIGQRSKAIQMLEMDLKNQPFHISGLLHLARLRILTPAGLWMARKDLQNALSRLPHYGDDSEHPPFETDLGVDMRRPISDLRAEIDKNLELIESGLSRDTSD